METVQLEGVQYVTDSTGKRTAVLISLEEWGDLWEDIYDVLVSHGRMGEPTVSWETLKKELVALELCREGRISAGKAAELAGMRKVDFIELLSRMGIDYLNQPYEELAADVVTVERLLA